jgi:hypothetical protein
VELWVKMIIDTNGFDWIHGLVFLFIFSFLEKLAGVCSSSDFSEYLVKFIVKGVLYVLFPAGYGEILVY